MRQDRPSAGRPRHAAKTNRPGEAPRHAQGAGMPSDVLADPKERQKQEGVDMAARPKDAVEMTSRRAAAKVRYWDNLKKLQILFNAQ